jgi:DNA mismatch repair protein MutS
MEIQSSTPMMQQYLDLKNAHQDCILFFRLGDFYEMFFEDALIASKILDIALTKRGKNQGEDIPMCGVPASTMETYLTKLLKAGVKVALCEQLENPADAKKRGVKAVVKRDVVRIFTPGTLTEDNLLDPHTHNFLLSLLMKGSEISIAYIDISTGHVFIESLNIDNFMNVIQSINPKEILIADHASQSLLLDGLSIYKQKITRVPYSRFHETSTERIIHQYYQVKTTESFGHFSETDKRCLGSLIGYLEITQKNTLPPLAFPYKKDPQNYLEIDMATRKNLELTYHEGGLKEGTLFAVLNETNTPFGSRLLHAFFLNPLKNISLINNRLDHVEFFYKNFDFCQEIRNHLKGCFDIERALGRLKTGRAKPRDLAAIRDSLHISNVIRGLFLKANHSNDFMAQTLQKLHNFEPLVMLLQKALNVELPAVLQDGGVIAQGYHAGLDELHMMRDDHKRLMADLQSQYIQKTGIQSLKIRHNDILGYFIETPPSQADKAAGFFKHKQTLASAVRFITDELIELERSIQKAAVEALALEISLFQDLVQKVLESLQLLYQTTETLAHIDVFSTLGYIGKINHYTRPFLEESSALMIEKGRHPVIERMLKSSRESFIPNSCEMNDQERLWIMTGPNMAGKSTFLRQNALIIIMAQIGSFVPADNVHIGLVDRLFSRVGASDDLARGHSTFMVEMIETATILNQATSQSFVILDEVGRGTATFDGLAIALASLEHLHNINQCRGLFATHYHEITKSLNALKKAACYTMEIQETGKEIVFLHKVKKGVTDQSYGLHVAGLAGIPSSVIQRAYDLLHHLEKQQGKTKMPESLPLFERNCEPQTPSKVENLLKEINPDSLSPMDALSLLYKLKANVA